MGRLQLPPLRFQSRLNFHIYNDFKICPNMLFNVSDQQIIELSRNVHSSSITLSKLIANIS